MNQVRAIRQQRRAERIDELRRAVASLLANRPGLEVWLFGSWARGDWDALSDLDLIAVGPTKEAAEQLAEDLCRRTLADDVIGLTHSQWIECRSSPDPLWRGIVWDAIPLAAMADR
jgi:predicted nucleotidyltransferase